MKFLKLPVCKWLSRKHCGENPFWPGESSSLWFPYIVLWKAVGFFGRCFSSFSCPRSWSEETLPGRAGLGDALVPALSCRTWQTKQSGEEWWLHFGEFLSITHSSHTENDKPVTVQRANIQTIYRNRIIPYSFGGFMCWLNRMYFTTIKFSYLNFYIMGFLLFLAW